MTVSRNTFAAEKNRDVVQLHADRAIVDADWNELQSIRRYTERKIIKSLIGDRALGDTFLVEESVSDTSNNFKIKGDDAFFMEGYNVNFLSDLEYKNSFISDLCATTAIASGVVTAQYKSWIVDDLIGCEIEFTSGALSGNSYTITDNAANTITVAEDLQALGAVATDRFRVKAKALTTPSGSNRTDEVYLQVWEEQITGEDDTTIVDPTLAEEACQRIVIRAAVRVAEGTTTPASDATHFNVKIATLARLDGDANISTAMITDDRPTFGGSTETRLDAIESNNWVTEPRINSGAVSKDKLSSSVKEQMAMRDRLLMDHDYRLQLLDDRESLEADGIFGEPFLDPVNVKGNSNCFILREPSAMLGRDTTCARSKRRVAWGTVTRRIDIGAGTPLGSDYYDGYLYLVTYTGAVEDPSFLTKYDSVTLEPLATWRFDMSSFTNTDSTDIIHDITNDGTNFYVVSGNAGANNRGAIIKFAIANLPAEGGTVTMTSLSATVSGEFGASYYTPRGITFDGANLWVKCISGTVSVVQVLTDLSNTSSPTVIITGTGITSTTSNFIAHEHDDVFWVGDAGIIYMVRFPVATGATTWLGSQIKATGNVYGGVIVNDTDSGVNGKLYYSDGAGTLNSFFEVEVGRDSFAGSFYRSEASYAPGLMARLAAAPSGNTATIRKLDKSANVTFGADEWNTYRLYVKGGTYDGEYFTISDTATNTVTLSATSNKGTTNSALAENQIVYIGIPYKRADFKFSSRGLNIIPESQETGGVDYIAIGDDGGVEKAAGSFFYNDIATKINGGMIYLGTNNGSPTGAITVEIQPEVSGKPSGTPVTNGTASIASPSASAWNLFTFATPPELSAGTGYFIVLSTVDQATGQYYRWRQTGNATTGNGGSKEAYTAYGNKADETNWALLGDPKTGDTIMTFMLAGAAQKSQKATFGTTNILDTCWDEDGRLFIAYGNLSGSASTGVAVLDPNELTISDVVGPVTSEIAYAAVDTCDGRLYAGRTASGANAANTVEIYQYKNGSGSLGEFKPQSYAVGANNQIHVVRAKYAKSLDGTMHRFLFVGGVEFAMFLDENTGNVYHAYFPDDFAINRNGSSVFRCTQAFISKEGHVYYNLVDTNASGVGYKGGMVAKQSLSKYGGGLLSYAEKVFKQIYPGSDQWYIVHEMGYAMDTGHWTTSDVVDNLFYHNPPTYSKYKAAGVETVGGPNNPAVISLSGLNPNYRYAVRIGITHTGPGTSTIWYKLASDATGNPGFTHQSYTGTTTITYTVGIVEGQSEVQLHIYAQTASDSALEIDNVISYTMASVGEGLIDGFTSHIDAIEIYQNGEYLGDQIYMGSGNSPFAGSYAHAANYVIDEIKGRTVILGSENVSQMGGGQGAKWMFPSPEVGVVWAGRYSDATQALTLASVPYDEFSNSEGHTEAMLAIGQSNYNSGAIPLFWTGAVDQFYTRRKGSNIAITGTTAGYAFMDSLVANTGDAGVSIMELDTVDDADGIARVSGVSIGFEMPREKVLVTAAYASGTNLEVESTALMTDGDTITIFSNNATYEGLCETRTITVVDSTNVTLSSALDFDYNIGDPVVFAVSKAKANSLITAYARSKESSAWNGGDTDYKKALTIDATGFADEVAFTDATGTELGLRFELTSTNIPSETVKIFDVRVMWANS